MYQPDDPMLPEGAANNPLAPYNETDGPSVIEYEVLCSDGRTSYVETYEEARNIAVKIASRHDVRIEISEILDNGEAPVVAELGGDGGEVYWETGEDYEG